MTARSNYQEVDTEADDVVLADPVLRLIYTGRAKDLDEAEEIYLNESLPLFFELVAGSMSNEELQSHELTQLLIRHGMRAPEDSLW